MISSEEASITIDIGWPMPQNVRATPFKKNKQDFAFLDWDDIEITDEIYIPELDCSLVCEKIIYRVMINEKTYLAKKSHIEYKLPYGGETCFKVKAIYELDYDGPYYIQSDWSYTVCIKNPQDPYCIQKCEKTKVTKTKENVSRRMRYASAVSVSNRRAGTNFVC